MKHFIWGKHVLASLTFIGMILWGPIVIAGPENVCEGKYSLASEMVDAALDKYGNPVFSLAATCFDSIKRSMGEHTRLVE